MSKVDFTSVEVDSRKKTQVITMINDTPDAIFSGMFMSLHMR